MRYLLSIALISLCFSLSAQETITYPYNPDGDVDGAIASPDLLDILGVYGGEFSPSEIQIDGVGLLQVIQELQNQIAAIQLLDVNYVESTLAAHQQEIETLQAENASLTQQVQDLQNAGFLTEETDPIASASGYATETWVEEQGYLTTETDPVATSAGYLTTETDPVAMEAMPTHLTQLSNWTDADNDGWNDHQYATTTDVLNIARDYMYSSYFGPNDRTFSNQNFPDMNWGGAWLTGYTFIDTWAPNSSFRYADLDEVTFVNTNLDGSDFHGAYLVNSTWINSFPTYQQYLGDCNDYFYNANLTGADFSQCSGAPGENTFSNADMSGAIIPDSWENGWYGEPSVWPDGWTEGSCGDEGCFTSSGCYTGQIYRRWVKVD
tara:strand:- start:1475 stop:2611 length:1137 start_codon:yes stop_codon:yes gene_type:complete